MRHYSRRLLALTLTCTSAAAVATTAAGAASAQTTSTPTAIRINAGGGAVVEADGRQWLADSFVTGGRIASTTTVTSPTPAVDRSERYGTMSYSVPVVAEAPYVVRLHLTEIWFSTAGKRVFDVSVEGQKVLVNKDLLAPGTRMTTEVVEFPARASDGRIDIAFTSVVNNASVTGIELLPVLPPAPVTATSPSGQAVPTADPAGYVRSFVDDFSGTVIDGTKWGRYSGQPGSDPGTQWAPSHVVVGGGVVSLETYRDPVYLNKWTSGGINNARSGGLTAGKYEIRMRADAGKGLNVVGLLWPKNNVWPPEIDFVEDRDGDRTDFTSTLHYRLDGVHKMLHGRKVLDMTQWHTYGVEWKPGLLAYTVDGVPWKTVSSPYVPTVDMGLAIQTNAVTRGAVLADATTPARSKVEIDWVVGYRLAS